LSKVKRESRGVLAAFAALELGTAGTLIFSIVKRNRMFVFLCFVQAFLLAAPAIMEKLLSVQLSNPLKIILMCWIFGCIALGTIYDFYYKFDFWDLAMHGTSGFLLTGLGFSLSEMLEPRSDYRPGRFGRIVCAFCFSMAIASMWELLEYGIFRIFGRDVQHDEVLHNFVTSFFTGQDAVSNLIDGITGMTIYTKSGVINVDGYLDIGFYDTMDDIFAHFVGTALLLLLAVFKKGKYVKAFIPSADFDASPAIIPCCSTSDPDKNSPANIDR